jgi:hypothetical protein
MADFVNDNVALPEPKNEQTVPLGKEARFIRGQDYNALRDAAGSLRTNLLADRSAHATKTELASETSARQGGDAAERAYVNTMLAGIGAPEANAARIAAQEAHTSGFVNVRSYGAKGDGVTDDTAALNAAFGAFASGASEVALPPGTYHLTGQVTLAAPSDRKVSVRAYGAKITTAGAISGIKVTGGGPNGGVTIFGLTVNHRGNATATAGFEFIRTWRAKCVDCNVVAHGVSANYAAARIANEDPANNDTGSFWTTLQDFSVRKFAGADVGDITHGVLIEGAGNATRIIGGTLSNVTAGVKVRPHAGQSYVAAATVIDGVAFESYGTAFEAPSNVSGVRFVNSRMEDGTAVFSLLAGGGNPNVPAFLAGNYMVSDAGTYLVNPDAVVVNSLDMSSTPSIIGSGTKTRAHWIMEAPNGSTDVLTLKALGGGRGLQLKKSDDTSIAGITWTGTGEEVEFKASQPSGSKLFVTGVKGLSGSPSVRANNLRGLATFAGTTTKAVVFPNAEADTDYRVTLGPGIAGSFWVTDKTTAGFTINAEAAKTGPVDWMLVR